MAQFTVRPVKAINNRTQQMAMGVMLKFKKVTDVLVYVLGSISVICMLSGAVVAHLSNCSPSYTRSMEILFGGLVMSGLGMLDILIVVGL